MTNALDQFHDFAFRSKHNFAGVDRDMLQTVQNRAREVSIRRARVCCHERTTDSPQEMLICLEPGSYIRPHRHHGRAESGLALEGVADAVFFDDNGNITETWPMGPMGSGLRFFYRIQQPVFHCLVVRNEPFIFHEVSTGPFEPDGTEYSPWSADAADADATAAYLSELRTQVTQFQAANPTG